MKIICIGRNYIDHIEELNNLVPKNPLIFMKPSTSLLEDNRPFYYPKCFEGEIHYEVELVVKICKEGKDIKVEESNDYYKEITVGIDLTARDVQARLKKNGHPWEIAKAFDHSAVVGKFIPLKESYNENGVISFSMTKNE